MRPVSHLSHFVCDREGSDWCVGNLSNRPCGISLGTVRNSEGSWFLKPLALLADKERNVGRVGEECFNDALGAD